MNLLKKDNTDLAALLLRVGFGFFMAFGHGWGKLNMLLDGKGANFPKLLFIPSIVVLILAVFSEFFASLFVLAGFKTKLASIPVILTMAVAAFYIHWGDPLFASGAKGGSKEFAMLFLFGFLAIFFVGSGKYSLDRFLSKKG